MFLKKIKLNKPSTYTLKRCEVFGEFSAESSADEYARRNQHSLDKIKLDIYRGKVAEFMVYDYLTSKGNRTNLPDLEIYDRYQKSFDADLTSEGHDIHVKSHVINPSFPVSWVFQKRDKLTKGDSEDFLCLVVMDDNWDGWFYIEKAKMLEFKPPMKYSLQASKVCIYEEDLNAIPWCG